MIQKDLGWCRFFVTDREFGNVRTADESFEKRFSATFGIAPKATIWMQQVHSPEIQMLNIPIVGSRIFPQTDGLMTNQSNTLLISKTADCVPILLWNEKKKIVASLHCGWRGFFRGMLESFQRICADQGLFCKDFSVFLGPHLRREHFEVKEDFVKEIPENKKKYLLRQESRSFYDLTLAVTETLKAFGMEKIEDSGIDTMASHEYFSHRAMGESYSTFASCIIMTSQ